MKLMIHKVDDIDDSTYYQLVSEGDDAPVAPPFFCEEMATGYKSEQDHFFALEHAETRAPAEIIARHRSLMGRLYYLEQSLAKQQVWEGFTYRTTAMQDVMAGNLRRPVREDDQPGGAG